MLCDTVVAVRLHAPAIHTASHIDHGQQVAWVSNSMCACGSTPIVMVPCLAAQRAPRVPL